MSTMRNAVQRRNHRERAQPAEREKWGLLEKHKDYSKRARDFNVKKTKLKALRQKAIDRNPDEFYFGMLSRSGPNARGRNATGTVDNGANHGTVLRRDTVRLMKTQDLGYVRTTRTPVAKEVEMLRRKLAGEEGMGKARKVVFVDGVEQQREMLEGATKGNDDDGEDESDWEGFEDDGKEEVVDTVKRDIDKLQRREKEKMRRRLAVAEERLKTLTEAEEALDLQRAKMGKSPTVGGVNKKGVKFKARERKR